MDSAMSLAEATQTLVAEFSDVLPETFIASTVEAAALLRGADAPAVVEIARADVRAVAQAALRAGASADSAGTGLVR
jgi:hypothetical protein